MLTPSILPRDEVFRCFWLLCLGVADLVHLHSQSHPDEFRCEWRRHSLVVSCSGCLTHEISVQRRKDLAFCTTNPGRTGIWQARIIMTSSGNTGFAWRGTVASPATTAGTLFQVILMHAQQSSLEMARAAGQG